jgi:starch-binding outer membrane protein, SusD/RagB family
MHRYRSFRVAALFAVILGLTACDDLLQGPGLTENPNSPTAASAEQLFMGIQARQAIVQQGQLARTSSIWIQQISGVFNQQKEYGSFYNYSENEVNQSYQGIYVGGGLIDQRKVQEMAAMAGNVRLEAMAMIYEALTIGTATALWGDIVYREAVTPGITEPKLDPQQQIYEDLQALLDQAITKLQGAPTAAYPQDLIYGGNPERWRRAAYTLKARYWLHVAPRVGQTAYQNALAAANQGINEAPANAQQAMHGQAPGDWRHWHGTTLDDANVWSQFDEARADMVGNARFIDVLKARNDPRLAQYFSLAADDQYRGANQFGNPPADGSTNWSRMNRTLRLSRPFRQPIITWAENQLIIAEAQFQLGQLGPALTAVNNVRTAVGLAALPGPITLEQIMIEKWIAQFQNIDAYSDYRRTCFPRIVPGGPNPASPASSIPFRFPYGASERLQNPANIPLPSAAPTKNWSHENITCPTTGGTI